MGLSAGGYGAVMLALHHLPAFAVVESWSGYFHPTDPAGERALDLGTARANAHANAHAFVKTLRRGFASRLTFFAFYVGRGDARFRDENRAFHRELTAAGVPHLFRIYPGGHEQSVWSAHARAWLAVAVDHLARRTQTVTRAKAHVASKRRRQVAAYAVTTSADGPCSSACRSST